MQRIESRLTFVINYKANSDKETTQLLQSINKSKSDVDAVIVCDDNTKLAIEKSQTELGAIPTGGETQADETTPEIPAGEETSPTDATPTEEVPEELPG